MPARKPPSLLSALRDKAKSLMEQHSAEMAKMQKDLAPKDTTDKRPPLQRIWEGMTSPMGPKKKKVKK